MPGHAPSSPWHTIGGVSRGPVTSDPAACGPVPPPLVSTLPSASPSATAPGPATASRWRPSRARSARPATSTAPPLIRARYARLTAALAGCRHSVHYALKANSTLGLVAPDPGPRRQRRRQLGRRDRSRAEGRLPAGPDRLHRRRQDRARRSRARSTLGLKAINAESRGELERIDAESLAPGPPHARRAAREPGRRRAEPSAHLDRDATQQVRRADWRGAGAAREMAQRPGLQVVGVHVHVGSQITTLEPLSRAAERMVALAADLKADGVALEHLDLGGGLGISYDGGPEPDVEAYARDRLRRGADHRPVADRRAGPLAGRATPARCSPHHRHEAGAGRRVDAERGGRRRASSSSSTPA